MMCEPQPEYNVKELRVCVAASQSHEVEPERHKQRQNEDWHEPRGPPISTHKGNSTACFGSFVFPLRNSEQTPSKQGPRHRVRTLFEQLDDGHILLRVLLRNFSHGHLKVLLCHVNSSFPQRKHARFRAHALYRSTGINATRGKPRATEGVHTLHSAPEALGIFSAIFRRLMPRIKFILRL
jgi:hypothetical protein